MHLNQFIYTDTFVFDHWYLIGLAFTRVGCNATTVCCCEVLYIAATTNELKKILSEKGRANEGFHFI